MSIDEKTLKEERLLLQREFDSLLDKLKKFEDSVAKMKSDLSALNGAIQQTDKLIGMVKTNETI